MSKSFPLLKTVAIVTAIAGAGAMTYTMYKVINKLDGINAALEQTQEKVSNKSLAQNMLQVIELREQHQANEESKLLLAPWEGASSATDKRIYGKLDAAFTLVEFSDLECPYCKKFHNTPKEIVDASNGNVNWEWKHLPLGFHNPSAEIGALATECAGQLKDNKTAWAFIDLYFRKSPGNGAGVNDINSLAKSLGIDPISFLSCMQSSEIKAKIAADASLASRSGVNGTPATFVVDNRTGKSILLGGAQPADSFVATMRKLEEHYQSTLNTSKPDIEVSESIEETN